eukprot:Hpha_TRINITY_DN15445_c0_g2::TRINITY_DN15445_c0_g2_i1::g.175068::m.175068
MFCSCMSRTLSKGQKMNKRSGESLLWGDVIFRHLFLCDASFPLHRKSFLYCRILFTGMKKRRKNSGGGKDKRDGAKDKLLSLIVAVVMLLGLLLYHVRVVCVALSFWGVPHRRLLWEKVGDIRRSPSSAPWAVTCARSTLARFAYDREQGDVRPTQGLSTFDSTPVQLSTPRD